MQVYALNRSGKRIYIREAQKGQDYICLECSEVVRPRLSPFGRPHFYHATPKRGCSLHNKSFNHLLLQKVIQTLCGHDCEQECPFPEIGRIADLAWKGPKIVFEIQCSPIEPEEVLSRIADYERIGWQIIWILDDMQFCRKGMSLAEEALGNRPHYFFHANQIYDICSVTEGEERLRTFYKRSLDPSKIQAALPLDEKKLPRALQKRVGWKIHIEGDLVDGAIKGFSFPEVFSYEEELKKGHTTFHGLGRLGRIIKAFWMWNFLRNCSRS